MDEKIAESKRFKEKGTNYFKAGNYHVALRMYKKAVDHLEYGDDYSEGKSNIFSVAVANRNCLLLQRPKLTKRKSLNCSFSADLTWAWST